MKHVLKIKEKAIKYITSILFTFVSLFSILCTFSYNYSSQDFNKEIFLKKQTNQKEFDKNFYFVYQELDFKSDNKLIKDEVVSAELFSSKLNNHFTKNNFIKESVNSGSLTVEANNFTCSNIKAFVADDMRQILDYDYIFVDGTNEQCSGRVSISYKMAKNIYALNQEKDNMNTDNVDDENLINFFKEYDGFLIKSLSNNPLNIYSIIKTTNDSSGFNDFFSDNFIVFQDRTFLLESRFIYFLRSGVESNLDFIDYLETNDKKIGPNIELLTMNSKNLQKITNAFLNETNINTIPYLVIFYVSMVLLIFVSLLLFISKNSFSKCDIIIFALYILFNLIVFFITNFNFSFVSNYFFGYFSLSPIIVVMVKNLVDRCRLRYVK